MNISTHKARASRKCYGVSRSRVRAYSYQFPLPSSPATLSFLPTTMLCAPQLVSIDKLSFSVEAVMTMTAIPIKVSAEQSCTSFGFNVIFVCVISIRIRGLRSVLRLTRRSFFLKCAALILCWYCCVCFLDPVLVRIEKPIVHVGGVNECMYR